MGRGQEGWCGHATNCIMYQAGQTAAKAIQP